jgi:hypothetical protein
MKERALGTEDPAQRDRRMRKWRRHMQYWLALERKNYEDFLHKRHQAKHLHHTVRQGHTSAHITALRKKLNNTPLNASNKIHQMQTQRIAKKHLRGSIYSAVYWRHYKTLKHMAQGHEIDHLVDWLGKDEFIKIMNYRFGLKYLMEALGGRDKLAILLGRQHLDGYAYDVMKRHIFGYMFQHDSEYFNTPSFKHLYEKGTKERAHHEKEDEKNRITMHHRFRNHLEKKAFDKHHAKYKRIHKQLMTRFHPTQ